MKLGKIAPAAGATKLRRRRGKGASSGIGGTSGKGHKGLKARSGGRVHPWFEGGQMPLQRRLPKRGFRSRSRRFYQVLNLSRLADVPANTVVDRAWLTERRMVHRKGPIKVLGTGPLKGALTLHVDAVSQSARQAIESAGGRVETPKAEA